MIECANRDNSKAAKCERQASPGHVYCNPCRLATGGYDRYTPSAVQNRTQNSSNKQE